VPRIISPKIPVKTRLTLLDEEVVQGELFVAAASPHHPGAETLLELLNDNTRSFLPFQTSDGMLLLNRTAIRTVDFESPELLAVFTRPDNDCIYALTVVLRTGEPAEFQGFCYTGELRPEGQRPIDLLNSPDMFLLLYSNERMLLVNKNAISHALV
jgi:hypothetical protein